MGKILRVLGLLVLGYFLLGFGTCGAYGIIGGLASLGAHGEDGGFAPLLIIAGALGLGIAWACWLGVRTLWRDLREPPDKPAP